MKKKMWIQTMVDDSNRQPLLLELYQKFVTRDEDDHGDQTITRRIPILNRPAILEYHTDSQSQIAQLAHKTCYVMRRLSASSSISS